MAAAHVIRPDRTALVQWGKPRASLRKIALTAFYGLAFFGALFVVLGVVWGATA